MELFTIPILFSDDVSAYIQSNDIVQKTLFQMLPTKWFKT